MAKRLQVILQDPDYRDIQRMARSRHMSIAEWVRQALDLARRREPVHDTAKSLLSSAAVQHNGPTADIQLMLSEIERGYLSGA